MALDSQLLNLKSAGVYRFEEDRSQIIDMPISQTRLFVGFSKKGPFNTPVYIRDTKQFKEIFGDIDRTLEKKGSYFHRSVLTALLSGPVYVMNMLKLVDVAPIPSEYVDDPSAIVDWVEQGKSDLDLVDYIKVSTSAAVVNDNFGKSLYSGMYNSDKFWYADSEAMLNNINANIKINDDDTVTFEFDSTRDYNAFNDAVVSDPTNDLLNFTNVSKKPVSIIVKKSDYAQSYNLTALDWYGSTNVPEFLSKDSLISDFFVDVYVISGNFGAATDEDGAFTTNPYERFATDPVYQTYFDKERGLIRSKFTSFINESEVSLVARYTGCLIPNFVDKLGNNVYIEKVINNNVDQIGLLCCVNETLFDNDEYMDGISGGLDMIGHTIYDKETGLPCSDVRMLSYEIKNNTGSGSGNGENTTEIPSYDYNYVTDEELLNTLIEAANIPAFEDNMVFVKKDLTTTTEYPTKADKLEYYTHLKVGNYMIGKPVWKDSDGNEEEEADEMHTRLTRINAVRNVVIEVPVNNSGSGSGTTNETYMLVTCQSEINKDVSPTGAVSGDIVKVVIPIDDLAEYLHVFTLNGFKLKKSLHLPNGTNVRQNEIIDYVLGENVDSSISKGLISRDTITFRYLIDTFGLGLESNCKWKYTMLCKKRQSAFAIINAPAAKDFRNSVDPSFKDGTTLSSLYISQGGNLSKNPAFLFSLPTIEQGASWGAYFYPYITVRDLNKNIQVPPAAYVSNNFMEKYTNSLPWSLVAGTRRGVITGSTVVGTETAIDDSDRDYLEPFGINCIVWKKGVGPVIFANKTAQQTPKSALSSIHVREAIIYIQDGVENILKNYLFEFNTAQTRLEIKTLVDAFLKSVQSNDGIYDFKTVMNETNNTNEVIDHNMGVLDMYIEPVKGMEIIAQRLTILRTGAIATGEI